MLNLAAKFGTTRVVTAGLTGFATMLSLTLLWTPDMPYWPLAFWFYGLALSMGWVMGPGTASVMGAVPAQKSGVASAMNDVTRQVAGALGTAIVGSLISTVYASKIHDSVASLPESSRIAAEDSVCRADAVASTLPAAQGADLMHAAGIAFTDELGIGLLVAAVAAVFGAFAVRRWLPPRPLAVATDVAIEPSDEDTYASIASYGLPHSLS
jgi:MFS family permease